MTLREIADLSGVHRAKLSRNPESPEVQSRLGPITAAYSARRFKVVPPKWAHDPLLGKRARVHGGRYNPPGVSAF